MTIPVHRFAFILLMCLSIPLTSTAQTVTIPDSNLRAVIEVALGKASGDPITTSDMAALPSLEARESNISNLTGLEHAINLTWLNLKDNSISDLSSLAGLTNLTWLHLRYNTISDITSLSGLTNLTLLYLGGNLISDISVVSGLTNLRTLGLWNNMISDISAVSGLTDLRTLGLWNNTISDISAVSGLTNLTELYLSGNTISDITSLSGLTNLTLLDLRYNTISDLSSLSGLTNLTELYLSGNTISDITSLSGLTNLTVLYLGDNSVSDISAVSGLTDLRTLGLWNNTISDISAVSGLTNLTVLYLGDNSVSDISAVSGLTDLRTLGLWNNTISDISAVSGLTNLTELYLSGNTISDITSLSGLTNLTELSIWDNTISDITSLSGLTNLTELDLYGNTISDLSPLVANTGLGSGDTVIVRFNPLSSVSIDMYIPALQSRGVTVKFDNQAHPALLKISGNNQRRTPGGTLANPFVVEVQDENGLALAGVTVTFAVVAGGGTLSTTSTTTDGNGRAQSTLTLGPNLGKNTVEVSADGIEGLVPFHAISDTESPPITADVNGDGNVNILDLVLVAYDLGNTGANLAADVSGDGVVNILDLVLVAGMFGDGAAAPSAHPQVPETLTAVEVQGWLTDARALEVKDIIMKRGFMVLEQLLVALTPRETELLANYPNPFNPETWIPYRLAEDAFVTLTIYDQTGQIVRTLDVGHQIASAYETRVKAIYWDGRNEVGETVASGVYFYHLSAGNYSATRKMLILK